MSDTFVGEIRVFAGTYVPDTWLPCDGRLLKVRDYPDLAAILGARFGGDGKTSFALPSLNGRAGVCAGQRAGARTYALGQTYGQAGVTLTVPTLAAHRHPLQKKTTDATNPATAKTSAPSATSDLGGLSDAAGKTAYLSGITSGTADTMLHPVTVTASGGSPVTAHENRQPFLAMSYGICVSGDIPVRPSPPAS